MYNDNEPGQCAHCGGSAEKISTRAWADTGHGQSADVPAYMINSRAVMARNGSNPFNSCIANREE